MQWRGDVWLYEEGRYRAMDCREFTAELNRAVRAELIRVGASDGKGQLVKVTRNLVSNVAAALESITLVRGDVDQPFGFGPFEKSRGLLTMKNGLLDLTIAEGEQKEHALRPHSPQWFSTVKLPYDYQPDATCAQFLHFLNWMFQHDHELIALVQEWFGYCLATDPDMNLHKFIIFEGQGGNGKGVLLNLLMDVLGRENVSTVGVEAFLPTDRFSLFETLGKLANVSMETDDISVGEGRLKTFVAGEAMPFEKKHRQAITARPTARLTFATNNPPKFSDKTDGMWRRLILVPCRATMPEARQNPGLGEELRHELPGIFNWALEGLRRLRANRRFTQPASVRAAVGQFREERDPARVFLQEHCVEDPQGFLSTQEVYRDYRFWCELNGAKADGTEDFGKAIRAVFPRAMSHRPSSGGERVRGYTGVRRKGPSEVSG